MPARTLRFQTAKDEEAFDEVSEVLRSTRALALVGAGVARGLDYPDWQTLLDNMHRRVDRLAKRGQQASKYLKRFDDPLWRAEEYRRLLGKEYFPFLTKTFEQDRGTNAVTKAIVKLPFRHILTTNYDASLERAWNAEHTTPAQCVRWDKEDDLLEFLFRFHEPRYRRIVYVHGRWDAPESIVLTDTDYTSRYVRTEGASKRLFALFATQRFVFFGFSLADPDLAAIMREVNVAVGTKDKARHFAFIGLGKRDDREVHRSRMMLKFGIKPIFYDASRGHQPLDTLLHALLESCRVTRGGAAKRVRTRKAAVAGASRTPAPSVGAAKSMARAKPRRALSPLPSVTDHTDPQKGRFGGMSLRDRCELTAEVTASAHDDGWYDVRLRVRSIDAARPLKGKVRFHLHDTFHTPKRMVTAKNGVASLELLAYGAFTVGAELLDAKVRLELDLATLKSAPREFRLN